MTSGRIPKGRPIRFHMFLNKHEDAALKRATARLQSSKSHAAGFAFLTLDTIQSHVKKGSKVIIRHPNGMEEKLGGFL